MEQKRNHFGGTLMPVNLSIKNVPEELVARLRDRAVRNHRSLQGELMALIEESLRTSDRLTADAALAMVRGLGLRTPSESVEMVRADRDVR
jgi:antitoxin FitA